jgi:hypothetical protein
MLHNSSTSNSRPVKARSPERRFLRRLFLFLLPLAVIAAFASGVGLVSGELLPVRSVAWLQTRGKQLLFLPKFSDHLYRLKLEAVLMRRPDAVALGSSRANQWRSAMFRPTSFYNAANSIFVIRDYHRMLEEFGDYAPRVIIFSLDHFAFIPEFESVYRYQSKDDVGPWGSPEQVRIVQKVFAELVRNPTVLWTAPRDGVGLLGLNAMTSGEGFRIDGSYFYGWRVRPDVQESVAGIAMGTQWPVLPASHLDESVKRHFERFAELARRKGIALVGVTMPFAPEVRAAMEQSSRYEAWRQFESDETREWIRGQGVIYFDFGKLESFGGSPDEFVDPFHPSEPAYVRMLISMLADDKFRALFPNIDVGELKNRLTGATRLEAYSNAF